MNLYLFSAFGLSWVLLFAYLLKLQARQKDLERQIHGLETRLGIDPNG